MRSDGLNAAAARWAAGLTLDVVPPEVVESMRLRILDLIGVMLAAKPLPLVAAATRAAVAADPGGGAAILGDATPVSPMAASFVNGVMSAVLEYDDTHIESFIHPNAPVVAVAFPEAQRRRLPGRLLLEAALAGSELTCRLGQITPVRLHTLGFHPTAVFGVFGGAYALGRLRGLAAPVIADAIGAAGSLSAGLNASFEDGSSTKMMHVGFAATGALRAVALAEQGISGPAPVFEGRFGWFRSHVQGRDDLRFGALLDGLGETWEVLNVASKLYPCAFTMMPHIEAALALRARHDIRPEQIEGVTCLIGRRSFATMCEPVEDKRRPSTTWHGRISLQHTVAEALVRGRMDKDAYAEESLRDPVINAIADKVEYRDDPATDALRSGGTVRLRLRDGRKVEHRIDDMRGTRRNPLTREDVVAKFQANVRDVLRPDVAERAAEQILRLDRLEDSAVLFDALGGR
ncbi:MmgE/PrpD family protein [Roseomonas marmotae]|uniref:MmgE/PrpD family protein n=1 Tax=Roseomonas marmotae TaxID=2768161 RepID=A0ABS3KC32_9PROT|nr:MmgE/PrpD family protein [Roseomonas marmotae]MBO1074537.1 MmgE/PrpD family protein [Roseomonas marmotae]QTI81570.1 MmgE/PrpD family protein [Roseomonas marmotae]